MKSKILYSALLIVGFLAGASALSALAWQGPPPSPPGCDPLSYEGCNPPLNIGDSLQTKTGPLSVNFGLKALDGIALKLNGKIQIVDYNPLVPAENPEGKVLVSDQNGIGTWKSVTAAGSEKIFIESSPEFTAGCTSTGAAYQIPGRWQFCALSSVRHDDRESDSDFAKFVLPIGSMDLEGKMEWRIVNSCSNDRQGSGARCFNATTTLPNPLIVSCRANYEHAYNPTNVTWEAEASGGVGGYTYTWSGNVTGSGTSRTTKYSSNGTKTGTVLVTSGSQRVTCSDTVEITTVPALALTCGVNDTSAPVGQEIEWTVAPKGGYGNYSYVWSGTAVTADGTVTSEPGTATFSKTFSSAATARRALVTVTSSSGAGTSLSKYCYKDVTITP